MLIQTSTLLGLFCACAIYLYVLESVRRLMPSVVSLFAIGIILRFAWLQTELLYMASKETMRKSVEWGTHDIAVTGFLIVVGLYMASEAKK